MQAVKEDLNKDHFEAFATEIMASKSDVIEHIKHLEEWAADEPVEGAGLIFGTLSKARLRKEPLGVALIIGAWNFPWTLAISPLIAAVSAGCCVMVKPSELAPATQALVAKLVPQYLDPSAIRCITGGPREMSHILDHRFDHIFFTGSSKIARFITAAAAKHLTPTVLELGGQGPAIVTKTADIALAAKRIANIKFMNAGQICLTVNHVFADPAIYDEFVKQLGYWNDKFMEGDGDSQMAHIVNERNYDRLSSLLDKSQGRIAYGGKGAKVDLSFKPTIVTDVNTSDSLLSEELFGPICPVIKATYQEAYRAISDMPHPLGLYIFSTNDSEVQEILQNTNSGGVTINDAAMHVAVPGAPFGGVGASGYGSYHGPYGFKAFTHSRTVVQPPTWLEKLMGFRYPPYKAENEQKLAIKNTLGFRRGEGLADQKLRAPRSNMLPFLLKGLILLAALDSIRTRTGGLQGFVATLATWYRQLRSQK